MRTYIIKKITCEKIDWTAVPKAYIDTFKWKSGYEPKTFFQAVYNPEKGITIRMTCNEINPKAIYTKYMDPVYKDSCMEFFADFSGEKPNDICKTPPGYINCEVNSLGALLCCIGKTLEERIPLLDKIGSLPIVHAHAEEQQWSVQIFLSFNLLNKVYPKTKFKPGHTFYGNAFKCGDDCKEEHYGMWSPVVNDTPAFHMPEFFGMFTLEL